MTHETSKRGYRMRRRAEQQEQTRRRITEAAMHLHGTVGPARTSVSAIAARAGVQRATVYRHFPDERALFASCSGHWGAANPPPTLAAWAAIRAPAERLEAGLAELYAYYDRTEEMLANLLRDQHGVPVVGELLEGMWQHMEALRGALLHGRPERGRRRRLVRAALGHALSFSTWQSLVREQGLTEADAVALMARFVSAAGEKG